MTATTFDSLAQSVEHLVVHFIAEDHPLEEGRLTASAAGRVRAQRFAISLPFPYHNVAVEKNRAQHCLLYPALHSSSRFPEVRSELLLSLDF